MKLNRTTLFIIVSSLALLVVLVIQVNWILRTAQIKEELFNEKANMVLTRTAEALSSNEQMCRDIDTHMSQSEIHQIDSLFRHYMAFYNFRIDYSFEVIRPDPFHFGRASVFKSNVYNRRLDEAVSKNGLELKLIFPDKKQFIVAEMGPLFITSVLLIVVVLVLFWRTVLSLHKEKRISEHTTEFLNNMTHEFKTPLTNIGLAGKMINREATLEQPDKIKHYTGIILDENEKLRLQVEQVLSMTALERGEIPLQKTELDVHQLIREAANCISVQVESREGQLSLNLDAGEVVVMGDRTHLTNALCNLIDNALKYSGDQPVIAIGTSNREGQIIITVEDHGIGIDKQYHRKVFEAFFRVPTGDVHNVKGFGLGLAYVRKIVELHGGSIALRSEKANGTTFTINLPNA